MLIKYSFYTLLLLLALASTDLVWMNFSKCNSKSKAPGLSVSSLSDTTFRIIPSIESTYTYQIIPSKEGTFGYEILIGDKALIRQETIPGLPGLNGFRRRADAEKIAKLIVRKLIKGIMPPTIEKFEMDSLRIIY